MDGSLFAGTRSSRMFVEERAVMWTRFSLRTLLAITTCVAILMVGFLWFGPGVTVTVYNAGNSPIQDLQVHVAGKSYQLGDISSGAERKVKVSPMGESHVEISYQLPDGTTKRHSVDCYFESAYRGTVNATIRDGELFHSSHQIVLSIL